MTQFAVHTFRDLATTRFDPADYSALKFGSDVAAKKLGYQLADKFYSKFKQVLVINRCVVIPSAFNVVEIAATIMAKHFMNRLNDRLTREGHRAVEWTTMHRTMSYIQDYSYMSQADRENLLRADKLYINKDFIKDKLLLFVDDVVITGTHEKKVKRFLQDEDLNNPHMFCYYAQYNGNQASIEAQLNHSGVKTISDYVKLVQEPDHKLVVRAVRFLLDGSSKDLRLALKTLGPVFVDKLYHACLSKEYDKIEGYRTNFKIIRSKYDSVKAA